jgi:hypothetical protein
LPRRSGSSDPSSAGSRCSGLDRCGLVSHLRGHPAFVLGCGRGFAMEDAYRSGRLVVIGTAVLTILTWLLILV